MQRRNFLLGLAGLVAAPAVIRTAGILMPVKAPILYGDVLNSYDAEMVRAYFERLQASMQISSYRVVCDETNNPPCGNEGLNIDVYLKLPITPDLSFRPYGVMGRPTNMTEVKALAEKFLV